MDICRVNFNFTEREKWLLKAISKSYNLSMTKMLSKLISDEAKRVLSSLDNQEEFDTWVEVIDAVDTERVERDEEWKKATAERLKKARAVHSSHCDKDATRERMLAYKREWQKEYYKRKKREAAINEATSIPREDRQ